MGQVGAHVYAFYVSNIKVNFNFMFVNVLCEQMAWISEKVPKQIYFDRGIKVPCNRPKGAWGVVWVFLALTEGVLSSYLLVGAAGLVVVEVVVE